MGAMVVADLSIVDDDSYLLGQETHRVLCRSTINARVQGRRLQTGFEHIVGLDGWVADM